MNFYVFYIKNYIGTQGEVCWQLKKKLPPPHTPVVYATDLLRWWSRCCSYSVWLCGLYYRAIQCFKVLPCTLSPCFYISFKHCNHLDWGSFVHLFVLHVFIFVLFIPHHTKSGGVLCYTLRIWSVCPSVRLSIHPSALRFRALTLVHFDLFSSNFA